MLPGGVAGLVVWPVLQVLPTGKVLSRVEMTGIVRGNQMQAIEHWREWKERCALALCGDDARRWLPGFIHAKFVHFVEAYARTTNMGSSTGLTPTAADAWHRFETHFRLHQQPGGKSYKDWLFAAMDGRGYSAKEAIEAGATILLRDVVREWLRREYSSHRMLSLNAAAGGDTGDGVAVSLEELIPGALDTAHDVEQRELDRIAADDAVSAFAMLNRRERIALLAHEAGLSLAHPEVIRVAECGRNALNEAFHGALVGLAAQVRNLHPREDASVQASLACLMYGHVCTAILAWGKTENACAQFCKLV